MKIIITIDWHTKIKLARQDELTSHAIEKVNEMMQQGYIEGELKYEDTKGREYSGWWKRKITVH